MPAVRGSYLPTPLRSSPVAAPLRCGANSSPDRSPGSLRRRLQVRFPDLGVRNGAGAEEACLRLTRPLPPRPPPLQSRGACALRCGVRARALGSLPEVPERVLG